MNTATAATRTGRTVATVRTWCRMGAVQAVKVGGRWDITAESLAARHRIAMDITSARQARRRAATVATPAPVRVPAPRPAGDLVTFRKAASGEWVICGPADVLAAGREVIVTKRSGQTTLVTPERVGATFRADGREMRYGYLAAREPRTESRPRSPRQGLRFGRPARRRACVTGGNCSSHTGRSCGGWNCDAN